MKTTPRRATRPSFWVGALASVAIAATSCGSESAGQQTQDSDSSPTTELTSTTAVTTSPADSETTPDDAAPLTRLVTTPIGDVEVPVTPTRIITLDEYAAMNLLALGIEPMEVAGSYKSLISQDILIERGVTVLGQDDAFTLNLEAIAAAKPDLIVVTAESSFLSQTEALSDIAPTVAIPYPAPWRDVVTATGQIFGKEAEASALISALEAKTAALAVDVEEAPPSLSILGETFGITFAVSPLAAASALVEEAGFTRPAAQISGEVAVGYEAMIPLSFELIEEHDADIVAVMDAFYYDSLAITDVPTYQQLPAVQDGRDVVIDGDMWFGNHPFAAFWILEDLTAMAAGESQMGTPSDGQARWEAFLALLG